MDGTGSFSGREIQKKLTFFAVLRSVKPAAATAGDIRCLTITQRLIRNLIMHHQPMIDSID